MLVEIAKNKDVDSWLELLMLVKDNFPGLDLDEYRAILLKRVIDENALVIKDGETVTGALLFSRDTKELEFLAVHPQYRKNGIAKALIQYMFTLFPKGSRIFVVTYREGDEMGKAARRLYEHIGFTAGELITVFDYPCQEFYYII